MKFSNPFKTYDTTYQHFQGQQPALSYQPIRATDFLNTTLFFKRTKTLTKTRPGQSLPQLVGDHTSMEPTHAMEKTPTHTCIQIYPYTHIHVNHEIKEVEGKQGN